MDLQYTESQKSVYRIERKRKNLSQSIPFEQLPGETEYAANKRYTLYKNSILSQTATSSKIKNQIDEGNLKRCSSLILERNRNEQVDAVVILPNSSTSTSANFLGQLEQTISSPVIKTVTLSAKEDTTIKSVIRTIVKTVITDENLEDDLDFDRRLPFDLDLLDDWCSLQKQKEDVRIVLIFQDIDSFNVELLNKSLKLLNSFKSRFQIKLIFNIDISFKSFLLKLNYDVLNDLKIHQFHIEQTDLVLNTLVDDIIESNGLQISHKLSSYILDRFEKNVKNVDEFLKILSYSKMSIFFGNLLSVTFDHLQENNIDDLPDVYLNTLRMLPTFRSFINNLAHSKEHKSRILSLLKDNMEMRQLLRISYKVFKISFHHFKSVYFLITRILSPILSPRAAQNYLDIYNKLSNPDELKRFKFLNFFTSTLLSKNLQTFEQLKSIISRIDKESANDDYLQRLNMSLKILDFTDLSKIESMLPSNPALETHYDIELRKLRESFISIVEGFLKNSIKTKDSITQWYDYSKERGTETWQVSIELWQNGLFNELWLMDDNELIQKNLVPDYRNTLIDALLNHERYLSTMKGGDMLFSTTTNSILLKLNTILDPLLPTLFQISRETSLYLNIYDYYTVFKNSIQHSEVISLLKQLIETEEWEEYLNDDERYGFLYGFFNANRDEINGNQDVNDEKLWELISLAWFYQKCEELVWLGYLVNFGARKRRDILEKAVWKDL